MSGPCGWARQVDGCGDGVARAAGHLSLRCGTGPLGCYPSRVPTLTLDSSGGTDPMVGTPSAGFDLSTASCMQPAHPTYQPTRHAECAGARHRVVTSSVPWSHVPHCIHAAISAPTLAAEGRRWCLGWSQSAGCCLLPRSCGILRGDSRKRTHAVHLGPGGGGRMHC